MTPNSARGEVHSRDVEVGGASDPSMPELQCTTRRPNHLMLLASSLEFSVLAFNAVFRNLLCRMGKGKPLPAVQKQMTLASSLV